MRMWILIVVKDYCQTKKFRQFTFGTGSLLIGRMVSVVEIVTLDLESIEGLAFVKYHDCSQFPQVVNFSSVKKLMQTVKINEVSYTTQP